ncbi:hypothetical protein [Streptomyces litchfieldiae]|uniref:Uncharacterized protein n=1 Tax=Streptomyces litchfieldiae TaxID=3075543 RepID=A0ABU2MSX4_9ACTN|nr:hypothetical protein [Streptomyces sp. DSM 44938]MDT0344566.1 hypothetical protein [Streptomyces sp. DSM 44938]
MTPGATSSVTGGALSGSSEPKNAAGWDASAVGTTTVRAAAVAAVSAAR